MVKIYINAENKNDKINPMTVANALTEIFDMVDLLEISEHVLSYIKGNQNRDKMKYYNVMRSATEEEIQSVENYISSISKETGVNFWEHSGE